MIQSVFCRSGYQERQLLPLKQEQSAGRYVALESCVGEDLRLPECRVHGEEYARMQFYKGMWRYHTRSRCRLGSVHIPLPFPFRSIFLDTHFPSSMASPDGLTVPYGPPVPKGPNGGSLLYNEFIVYDVAQV